MLMELYTCAAHIAALSIGGQDDSAMFGVFDGHGAQRPMQFCELLLQVPNFLCLLRACLAL